MDRFSGSRSARPILPPRELDYWDKKPDTGCPARHRRAWSLLRSRAGSLALGSQDGMALDQALAPPHPAEEVNCTGFLRPGDLCSKVGYSFTTFLSLGQTKP